MPAVHAKSKGGRRRKAVRTDSRRGLGAIRAVCRAWRALKVFFPREWITIFRFFSVRRFFSPFFFFFNVPGKCFCSCIRISLKTARLAITLGSLCKDRFWGTSSSKFGRPACRAPCVTRTRAVCNAILFPRSKTKQNRPPVQIVCLGATLSLRTRARNPASPPFLFFQCWCFSLKCYT